MNLTDNKPYSVIIEPSRPMTDNDIIRLVQNHFRNPYDSRGRMNLIRLQSFIEQVDDRVTLRVK